MPGVRYDPLDNRKNRTLEALNLAVHLLILAGATALSALLLGRLSHLDGAVPRVALLLLCVVILAAGFVASIGRPSSLNFSRNAGLALIYSMAVQDAHKGRDAYILCDASAVSYLGIRKLAEMRPELRDKQVYILDCLGAGDRMMIAATPRMMDHAQALAGRIDADPVTVKECGPDHFCILSFLPGACLLELGFQDGADFYIPNLRTNKDCVVDLPRLERLERALRG